MKEAGTDILQVLTGADMETQALSGKVSFGVNYGNAYAEENSAVACALTCFEDGLVAVFVDGIRYEKLTEPLSLKEGSEVTFVRLTLAMETGLVKENMQYLEGITVSGCRFKVVIDGQGNADLEIVKGEKKQKAIPAALKKNEEVVAISGFKKKLKEQYARTVKMFEQGMENRERYSYKELDSLCENPVTDAILKKLVFVSEKGIGLLTKGGLKSADLQDENGFISLGEEDSLYVAHPWELFKSGKWAAFQR